MDSFVNPPQVLKEEARKRESELEKEKSQAARRFQSSPSATSCSSCSNTPR